MPRMQTCTSLCKTFYMIFTALAAIIKSSSGQYSSLDGWRIAQVYAARLGYHRGEALAHKMKKNNHSISFYNVDNSFETVVVTLLINQEGELDEQYNLPAGSRIELFVKVPGRDDNARSKCTATMIDNVFRSRSFLIHGCTSSSESV
jgi:hypothetical protein